jgi:hypothetical protein
MLDTSRKFTSCGLKGLVIKQNKAGNHNKTKCNVRVNSNTSLFIEHNNQFKKSIPQTLQSVWSHVIFCVLTPSDLQP